VSHPLQAVFTGSLAGLCARAHYGHASQLAAARYGLDESLLTPALALALLRRAVKEAGKAGDEGAAAAAVKLENAMNQ
jgi:hypothetical protein